MARINVQTIAELKNWTFSKLENVYNFQYGQFNINPDNGGAYPIYGANGIIGGYTEFNAEKSVIIGHMGENAGSVLWEEGKHFVTYNGTIAKPKNENELNAKFGYYWLVNLNIRKICAGSGQPFLSYNDLNELPITFPPLPEQKKIASVLSALDDKIALNKKMNQKLERMAKRLYDYTFLQCAGHQTTYNKTLNRNIPAGWEVDNLYRIADFTNGLACQKYRPMTERDKLPVIKIREMHDGITADTEFVRSDIPEKVIVYPGDLLFSWSASLEVMVWNGVKGGLNQHIFKVTPKEYFSLYYVYFQLKDYIGNFKRMAEARKTTMGHITTDHLNQSRIAIPDEETMKRFSSRVTPLFKKQLVNSQQIETLTTQRNTLLPLLMTGQVVVG